MIAVFFATSSTKALKSNCDWWPARSDRARISSQGRPRRSATWASAAALHRDRVAAELAVQAHARGLAVDELVAGQDGAVDDLGRAALAAGPRRERDEIAALEPRADPFQQRRLDVVAELAGRVEERHMARLIGLQDLVLDHPAVVLDGALGDHHVADREIGIEAAGDAVEHQHAGIEAQRQDGRDGGGVDLADAGLVPGSPAGRRGGPGRRRSRRPLRGHRGRAPRAARRSS